MDRQLIDQTASETHLHRVLWLITFLRAMVLHVMLAVIAAVLFFVFGIDGVYPLATDMIHALRAQSIQNRIEGNAIGPWGFMVAAAIIFGAALLLLRWIYRSITLVKVSALRFQAALMAMLAVWGSYISPPQLAFAYENLSTPFAVLATFGVAMNMLMIPLGVAIALWRVSRAPERSSLLATFDPRLVRNAWVYVNKLLDLPRTPLRTLSTAGAYGLALTGALVLVASVMYLVTVGATRNKLDVLNIACGNHPDLLAQCAAQSLDWAWSIPFSLLLALFGIKAAALLRSMAKRLGGLSVSDILKKSDDEFLLYLRPFDVDDVVLPKPRLPWLSRFFSLRPFPLRIEEELFDVSDGYRPLIAVGKPGTSGAKSGGVAYRTYLEDSAWQDYVLDKIRRAERIVMVLKTTEGVRWEFERVLGEAAIFKTLFLFDPAMKDANDREAIEKMAVPSLQRAGVIPQDFRFQPHVIGFFLHQEKLMEIANTHCSATSYRTAFSFFLAESSGGGASRAQSRPSALVQ